MRAIENGESYADGLVAETEVHEPWPLGLAYPEFPAHDSPAERKVAQCVWDAVRMAGAKPVGSTDIQVLVGHARYYAAGAKAWKIVGYPKTGATAEGWATDWNRANDAEFQEQSRLQRDIFGNPFPPVAVDPSWLSSTVLTLANGIYADRTFDRMPSLADALQDAGCNNPDILDHCRSEGPHVRGCWVMDLLTGRK